MYSENEISNKNNKDLKTSICSIAKMENDYINHWCRYHLDLGFDDIYIYDNNDEDYEPVESRIDGDIISRVHIIKVPGIRRDFQRSVYNSFVQEHYNSYDWCAFIDLDEFIVLKQWSNIKDFLSQNIFENVDQIKFEWHLYGDNDEIKQDLSIPIYQRIKKEVFPSFRGGHLCKSIIRGNKQFLFENPHYARNMDRTNCHEVNINGEYLINTRKYVDRRYENAYIAHYMTKTLDEFIHQKFKRIEHLYDNSSELMSNENPYVRFQYFFYLNERTSEKLAYIKEKLNLDFIEKEGHEYRMYNPGIKYQDGELNIDNFFTHYLVDKLNIDKKSSLAIMGNILSAYFIKDTKYFWGCGASDIHEPYITDVKRYYAVAGTKTLKILGQFGDVSKIIISNPALLASFLYKPKVEKKYKLCLLSRDQDYNLLKDYASGEFNVITMKTNDIELILDKINECQFTVSTSLHGIVFSHSYGIKSIKLDIKNSPYESTLKYEDYYSVINREFKKINFEELNVIFDSDEKLQQLKQSLLIPSPIEIVRKQLEYISVSPVQNIFSDMKNIICTFIRKENEYEENNIYEWITYHIKVGYSDIFIFNSNETFKNFEDAFDESIKEKIHLFNVLTENNPQNEIISYFYQYMNRYFQSVTFIDINKYINLNSSSSCESVVK